MRYHFVWSIIMSLVTVTYHFRMIRLFPRTRQKKPLQAGVNSLRPYRPPSALDSREHSHKRYSTPSRGSGPSPALSPRDPAILSLLFNGRLRPESTVDFGCLSLHGSRLVVAIPVISSLPSVCVRFGASKYLRIYCASVC